MTQQTTSDAATTCSAPRHPDRTLTLVATGAAGLAWTMWHLGGADLTVHAGDGTQTVGLVSVLVTAGVASVAGLGLLRFWERRADGALLGWTVLACLLLLLSLLGPLGATTLPGGLALASLHLVVGSVVILGARSSRRRGVA